MKRSYIGFALGALVVVGAALNLPSCGHDQRLQGITVQPSAGFTFLAPDPSLTAQFTAIGSYIHPPATKDITSQVTWKSDISQLVTFSAASPGLVSPAGGGCGVTNVSATLPQGTGGASNIVIGYSTVTVNNPAVATCPGGGTEGTLGVQVVGPGTVTSLTGGISCPTQCIAAFPAGASVGLTATPAANHMFVMWSGCTSFSGNTCTVTVPAGGANVSATFQ
jgi:hypothetical protein